LSRGCSSIIVVIYIRLMIMDLSGGGDRDDVRPSCRDDLHLRYHTCLPPTGPASDTRLKARMLPFSTLILRSYYDAIGWNQDNSYSQLNRSSNGASFLLHLKLSIQLTFSTDVCLYPPNLDYTSHTDEIVTFRFPNL